MKCKTSECSNLIFAKNKCKKCYDKWYRHTKNGKLRRKLAQDKIRKTDKRKKYTKKYNNKYKIRRNKLRNLRKTYDIKYLLSERIRNRLYCAIKGKTKSGSSIKDLGCSVEFLKSYLESKFKHGMTWNNYGRKSGIRCWEIDHIKPLSSFDLENRKQFLLANNYKNLQPLWADENNKKRDK